MGLISRMYGSPSRKVYGNDGGFDQLEYRRMHSVAVTKGPDLDKVQYNKDSKASTLTHTPRDWARKPVFRSGA